MVMMPLQPSPPVMIPRQSPPVTMTPLQSLPVLIVPVKFMRGVYHDPDRRGDSKHFDLRPSPVETRTPAVVLDLRLGGTAFAAGLRPLPLGGGCRGRCPNTCPALLPRRHLPRISSGGGVELKIKVAK